jgi:Putative quorum-sensing-regulated virulence factor
VNLKLNDRLSQLLLLAMDPAGNPHEQALAAKKFFNELRKQFPDGGYELLAELNDSQALAMPVVGGDVTMPFGKYRGQPLSQIPLDYLFWCLDKASVLERNPYLRTSIELYVESMASHR